VAHGVADEASDGGRDRIRAAAAAGFNGFGDAPREPSPWRFARGGTRVEIESRAGW